MQRRALVIIGACLAVGTVLGLVVLGSGMFERSDSSDYTGQDAPWLQEPDSGAIVTPPAVDDPLFAQALELASQACDAPWEEKDGGFECAVDLHSRSGRPLGGTLFVASTDDGPGQRWRLHGDANGAAVFLTPMMTSWLPEPSAWLPALVRGPEPFVRHFVSAAGVPWRVMGRPGEEGMVDLEVTMNFDAGSDYLFEVTKGAGDVSPIGGMLVCVTLEGDTERAIGACDEPELTLESSEERCVLGVPVLRVNASQDVVETPVLCGDASEPTSWRCDRLDAEAQTIEIGGWQFECRPDAT